MRSLLSLGALFGLVACTPQQCDPSQAGFLSGIGCAASGSYAARNQSQRSDLAQQSAVAAQSRDQAQHEGARASEALLSRDQARRRLGTVDQQTAQLRTRLGAARARGGVDLARLNAAQLELDDLQRQSARLQSGASEEDVRALEARRRRINDQISAI